MTSRLGERRQFVQNQISQLFAKQVQTGLRFRRHDLLVVLATINENHHRLAIDAGQHRGGVSTETAAIGEADHAAPLRHRRQQQALPLAFEKRRGENMIVLAHPGGLKAAFDCASYRSSRRGF